MSHFNPFRNIINSNFKILFKNNTTQIKRFKRLISTTTIKHMRFVQYTCINNGPQRLGVQLSSGSDIIEISAVDPCLPNNLVDFLKGGPDNLEKAKRIIGEGKSVVDPKNANILSPLTNPDKVICVGLNYKSHCEEQKKPLPTEPFFFNKFPSTIIGPNDCVIHPPNTKALDWEIELGVVIAKSCRNVSLQDACNHIFGYTVCQDISARDWQTPKKNAGQWLFAKSMDTFCPVGPAVVAKEYINDPSSLLLRCSVNGEVMQSQSTDDMVFDVYHIVSYLSHCVTLLPGDLILTGTPAGVGVFRNPRIFLKNGDKIESEISGIGVINTRITT